MRVYGDARPRQCILQCRGPERVALPFRQLCGLGFHRLILLPRHRKRNVRIPPIADMRSCGFEFARPLSTSASDR